MNFLYFENLDLSSTNVKLSADVAEIAKDEEGHIGIAIGGGAPYCSCLYVVQVFEDSSVARDGRIRPGDEILAINGLSVKGYEKNAVAQVIRQSPSPIRISFNKLCFDVDKGQTFDIALKKFKHWFVESMDAKTADALGLSRAILCNDLLAELMDRLEINSQFYKSLIKKCSDIAKNYRQLAVVQDAFGSTFCEIAVREESGEAKALFTALGECHKNFRKEQSILASKIQDVVSKLEMYAEKAIPDTKNSIKKYLDVKFEYLAFCLKIKELEDEEAAMIEDGDYLPRLDAGNYEYRIILRCREKSRKDFIDMRKHVMVKIEMLDEKHVRELALYLRTLIDALKMNHENCRDIIDKVGKRQKDENNLSENPSNQEEQIFPSTNGQKAENIGELLNIAD